MLLFDEYPIVASKTLAREIGLNEALVLQQIYYWIEMNKRSGNNFYDGRYWTYNSIKKWQESDFDYMSFQTVKRTFSKLEQQGLLLTGNYNKDPRDKTKWYTLNNDKLEELTKEIELKKWKKQEELTKQTIQDVTNALGQNEPMEEIKMSQWNGSKWANAFMQNELMQEVKMNQPLPENTTKTTTKIITETSNKGRMDGRKEENKFNLLNRFKEHLKERTGYYEQVSLGNHAEADKIQKIIHLLSEVSLLDDNETVKINQLKLQAGLIKERFLALGYQEMEYIIHKFDQYDHSIHNIKLFIWALAYNASHEMDLYYYQLINRRKGERYD